MLNDSNFDQAVAENDFLLVEFYAPWCGHCKSLAPEWAKAAQKLASDKSPAKLAKVDATEATGLASKFEVKGFPTIKLFRSGVPSEYGGGRTEPEIISWVAKKSGPPAKTLNTLEDLEALRESTDVFVLGVFFGASSPVATAFEQIAAADENLVYAVTSSTEIQKHLALEGDAVVILKDFDDKRVDFPIKDFVDKAHLTNFISGNSAPLVQEFSGAASKKIFGSPIKIHSLFFTDKSSDHHKPTIDVFTEIAKEFKGKLLVVNIPSSEDRVLDYFGLKTSDLPKLILADMGGEGQLKKFPYDGKIDATEISTFFNNFFNGEVKPTLKSEEVAPEDTTGPVTIVKGKSFHDIVLNNDKDVLIEFYAPWCGHCKKLAPAYDELGTRMKSVSNVVIAKMDATANEIDVPGVSVQGYPTILFFKGNNKENPVKYEENGREADDFIDWLAKNSYNKFSHDEL